MSWGFVLPGQPPSWNASYHITRASRTRADGTPYEYSTLSKRQKIVDYQAGATLIIRSAKPSNWKPTGAIRVRWRIFLARNIDCDNIMKAVHDCIEKATGVNDSLFLPCVESKVWGLDPSQARIVITIEEEP